MHILCQRIAAEQNPTQFQEYVAQLNILLGFKGARLKAASEFAPQS